MVAEEHRSEAEVTKEVSDGSQVDSEAARKWSQYFTQYVEQVYSTVRDFTARASGAR